MQRLLIAFLFAVAFAGVIAVLARSATAAFERRGGVAAMTTGSAMQKAAFFLLLCLILYVSVSGAS